MTIKEKIQDLLSQVADLQASNAEQLEALRIKYLSKKGLVTELFNEFREVPKEEKREIGQALNALRQAYEARINEMRESMRLLGEEAKEVGRTSPVAMLVQPQRRFSSLKSK